MNRLHLSIILPVIAFALASGPVFCQKTPPSGTKPSDRSQDEKKQDEKKQDEDARRADRERARERHLDLVIPDHDEKSLTRDEETGLAWSYLERGPEHGRKLVFGDIVKAHMTCWRADDGSEVYSTRRREGRPGAAIEFNLGGFVRGLNIVGLQLREGDKVRVDCPSVLAFGKAGFRNIPPNTDLIYALEIKQAVGNSPIPKRPAWDPEKAIDISERASYMVLDPGREFDGVEAFRSALAYEFTLYAADGAIIASSYFKNRGCNGGEVGRFRIDWLNVVGKEARPGAEYLVRYRHADYYPERALGWYAEAGEHIFMHLKVTHLIPFKHRADAEMKRDEKVKSPSAPAIEYVILRPGEGKKIQPDDRVHIHHAQWVLDEARIFDCSYTRGETNNYSQKGLVPGMRQALAKIAPGGAIRVKIPPELAWGAAGRVGVPGDATILMHIELYPEDADRRDPTGELGPEVIEYKRQKRGGKGKKGTGGKKPGDKDAGDKDAGEATPEKK